MSDAQLALNDGAWFLLGCFIASVLWRTYYHRRLVQLGHATKETPLSLFVAFMVLLVVTGGSLYGASLQVEQHNDQHCQAQVNQNNVATQNDRTKSTINGLQGEIKFYRSLAGILSAPTPNVRQQVLNSIQQQINLDNTRVSQLEHTSLQPITDCHSKRSAAG